MKGGLLSILLSLIYFLIKFFFDEEIFRSSKAENLEDFFNTNVLLFIIVTSILVPVIEEITFRGFFALKKWFLIIPIIFTIFLFYNSSFSQTFVIIYSLLYFIILFFSQKMKIFKYTFFIINSFSFAMLHYSMDDLFFLDTYFMVLVQFGAGLILIWVTVNFSLIKSMLVHGIINFMMVLPLILPLINFKDQEIKYKETKSYSIIWKERSTFNVSKKYVGNKNDFTGRNVSVQEYFNMYERFSYGDLNDSLNFTGKPFVKYDIHIKITDQNSSISEEYYRILKSLEEESLIEIIE